MSTAVTDISSAKGNLEPEIRRIFEKQKAHALTLRRSTAAERIDKLKRLKQAVLDRTEDIYKACADDFRKHPAEVDLTEILPVVMEINDAIRHVKKWMKNKRVRPTLMMLGTSSYVHYEPKGTSLIISPWNYPLNLTFCPLASAIAAGNTAVLKPSEMTPHCAQIIQDITAEVFDEQDVTTVQGAVEETQLLLAQPWDHIFFTGSPAVGRIVMDAAAKNLTSVTLELGGKSPVIVDKSANVKKAACNIAWGKFANNGQTCIAPDHIYVHEDIRDTFVEEVKSALEQMFGELTKIGDNPDYCRIVNAKHYARLKGILDDAQQHGAQVAAGGLHDESQDFLSPTLVTGVSGEMRIMQEEIFGPLMPILTYTDTQAVIDDINSREKPLALYIFSKDRDNIETLLNNTTAGGSCINTAMMQYLHGNLPFGGVNNSGIGAAHGAYGFKEFSHERAVVEDKFAQSQLFHPPYNDFTRKLIKLTMKYFV